VSFSLKSLLHQLGQRIQASAATGKIKTDFQQLSTGVTSIESEINQLKSSPYLTESQIKTALKGLVEAVGADWQSITVLGECHLASGG
jgi:hypothetical protein